LASSAVASQPTPRSPTSHKGMTLSYEKRHLGLLSSHGHSGGGTQVGAVVFRSDSSIAYANRTNTTIIAPVGIQDNDFLQTVFLIGGPTGLVPAVAPPTGFSEILTAPYPLSVNVGGFEVQSRLYWKPASGESGNYQFNHAAANTTAYTLFRSLGRRSCRSDGHRRDRSNGRQSDRAEYHDVAQSRSYYFLCEIGRASCRERV